MQPRQLDLFPAPVCSTAGCGETVYSEEDQLCVWCWWLSIRDEEARQDEARLARREQLYGQQRDMGADRRPVR
jgi:hypothetical protein